MKITRATVAKKAGVSVSTVSYVLNSSRYVSPKLTKKVMDAVEELGYTPDMAARVMVAKRSKILTIIANGLVNSIYGEIVMAIEQVAVKRGYFVNIYSGQLPLKEYVKSMIGRKVDGVYFASVPSKVSETDIEQLLSNEIAIACGNYLLPGEKRINRIEVDYETGTRKGIEHLIGLGHKNIVYINGFEEGREIDEKRDAFIKYMKMHGVDQPKIIYGYGENRLNEVEGRLLAQKLIRKYPETTAVICISDTLAYGVMQQLWAFGYKIPEDISVLGYENNMASNFTNPPLSSLSFDKGEFGQAVVDVLLSEIENGKLSNKLVNMDLCVRASTAKPRTF